MTLDELQDSKEEDEEDDNEDALTIMEEDLDDALELLEACQGHFDGLIRSNRLNWVEQRELMDLSMEVQRFRQQWNWCEGNSDTPEEKE